MLCFSGKVVKYMSWFNPTQAEAEDYYYYYKNKYYDAASEKRASERLESSLREQRQNASSKISSFKNDKINFERRLEGIKNIIKTLEGNGGWFSTNVPEAIDKANKALDKADSSYAKSIRVSAIHAASLNTAFHVKSVENDRNSAEALQQYRNERDSLAKKIEDLRQSIAQLNADVEMCSRKIRECSALQSSLRSKMFSYSFEMNHYAKFMN